MNIRFEFPERRHRPLCLALLCLFWFSSTAASQTTDAQDLKTGPYHEAKLAGIISNNAISEASGIADSYRNHDLLWIINDGGNSPSLYAITTRGEAVGEYRVENARNIDWEDLAVFRDGDASYLIIADVGDNRAVRTNYSLYIVQEPEIKRPFTKRRPLRSSWQIDFQYEDGPRDCEAIAVDARDMQILLISKRAKPPALYRLPLTWQTTKTALLAAREAQMTHIPPPTQADLKERYGAFRSQPTSMDLSRDGSALVVLTYHHAYYYERGNNQKWNEVLANRPRRIDLPHPNSGALRQREAICFQHHTGALYVTSEQTPTPLYILRPSMHAAPGY